jgi:hypothetical protein
MSKPCWYVRIDGVRWRIGSPSVTGTTLRNLVGLGKEIWMHCGGLKNVQVQPDTVIPAGAEVFTLKESESCP